MFSGRQSSKQGFDHDGIPLRVQSRCEPQVSFFNKLEKCSKLGERRARFNRSIRQNPVGIYRKRKTENTTLMIVILLK